MIQHPVCDQNSGILWPILARAQVRMAEGWACLDANGGGIDEEELGLERSRQSDCRLHPKTQK